MRNLIQFLVVVLFAFMATQTMAQKIQYSRANNQKGMHTFEPSKLDTVGYDGFKLAVQGAFTQGFQSLSHENMDTSKAQKNKLYAMGSGFNLAAANLNFDVQLGDGIRVFLENYMAARHHNEFWVKGGYIQIDKLPMFGNPEWFTKYVRAKLGHMEINYGDNHFRRSDGGNTIFNAFAENTIVDQFATEIGGELYVYPMEGLMFMVGLTNGLIRNNIRNYKDNPLYGTNKADSITTKSPSILAKLAYDNQFNDKFRFRLSTSLYHNSSSPSLTLYSGDRTGSNYFGVMEAAAWANSTADFTSGRFNPGFSNSITAFCINPFIKYQGLEFFGTYEITSGKTVNEDPDADGFEKRNMTQLSAELIYRFLPNEQLFAGLKYNTVSADLIGYTDPVTINRIAFGAGWFPVKNLLLKGEYVQQTFDGFKGTDIRHEGKFNGVVIQAVVGF